VCKLYQQGASAGFSFVEERQDYSADIPQDLFVENIYRQSTALTRSSILECISFGNWESTPVMPIS